MKNWVIEFLIQLNLVTFDGFAKSNLYNYETFWYSINLGYKSFKVLWILILFAYNFIIKLCSFYLAFLSKIRLIIIKGDIDYDRKLAELSLY